MGKHSRTKGRRWEQDVARRFREAMPGASIRRGWQARHGGDAPDVVVPEFWVECKAGKRVRIRAALEQALAASIGTGQVPVAVCKDDRKPPFVALRLDDFLELVRTRWELSRAVQTQREGK